MENYWVLKIYKKKSKNFQKTMSLCYKIAIIINFEKINSFTCVTDYH